MKSIMQAQREDLRLTARGLAELANTAETRVYCFERGRFLPKLDEAIRIATVLKLNPRNLFPKLLEKFDAAERGQI